MECRVDWISTPSMEGLEDQASEPRDMGDALSHSCTYDHEFVERLFFKFLGNHCRRCNCRDANGVDVWRCSGHCRTSARAIPFWICIWERDAFPHSNPLSLVIWTAQPNLKFLWGNTQLSNGRLRKNLASASNGNPRTLFRKIGNAIAKAIHDDKANPCH